MKERKRYGKQEKTDRQSAATGGQTRYDKYVTHTEIPLPGRKSAVRLVVRHHGRFAGTRQLHQTGTKTGVYSAVAGPEGAQVTGTVPVTPKA